jgi:hypothetical protein
MRLEKNCCKGRTVELRAYDDSFYGREEDDGTEQVLTVVGIPYVRCETCGQVKISPFRNLLYDIDEDIIAEVLGDRFEREMEFEDICAILNKR